MHVALFPQRLALVGGALGFLLCACSVQRAGTSHAESVFTMDDLRRIVADGLASGQKRFVIPPGVYKGGPLPGKGEHLAIQGGVGVTIIADGVSMICSDYTRAISIKDCSDVTLTGLTIDYDPLPFTQGDVVSVSPGESWVDVKIHAGYPYMPSDRIDVCDRASRYRKRGKPFMWDSKAELRGEGIVRISCKSAATFAKVGDLVSLGGVQKQVVAHTLAITHSARVTLKGVNIYASNCMGIVASEGEGGHRFIGCRVVPGPPPAGATEARILSTNADAILTGPMKKGVLTEGCEIRDAGDDSWSVQSEDYVVLKDGGDSLILTSRGQSAPEEGDRLLAAPGGESATIRAIRKVPRDEAGIDPTVIERMIAAKPWSFWRLRASEKGIPVLLVTLDRKSDWPVGTSLRDIDRQGDGFVFRNNRVRSSGRILVKASGLIENNVVDGPFSICANPEVPAGAASVISSLVIRGNKITGAHSFNPFFHSPQMGAISVTSANDKTLGFNARTYGTVTIESNTIEGGNGAAIAVTSAGQVIIRNNRIVAAQQVQPDDTGGRFHMDNHAVVWLSDDDEVLFDQNRLIAPGSFMSKTVVCAGNVHRITGTLGVTKH